jgi:hypothetical protein
MRRLALLFLVVTVPLLAQRSPYAPGTGNPTEHLVPWRFLEKDAEIPRTPVTLYWLPSSLEETKKSPMLTSHQLFDDSVRCVNMLIVLPTDTATIDRLGASGKLPMAVITDADGKVTRSVANVHGVLRALEVDGAMRAELAARDDAMYRDMTEARRVAATDKNAAIALYRKIWDARCLFPVAGTDAQRGLKSLGVTVSEPPSVQPYDPNLKVTKPTKKKTMNDER